MGVGAGVGAGVGVSVGAGVPPGGVQPPWTTPHAVDAHRAGELVPIEFHVQAPAEVLVEGRGTVEHVFHAPLADAVDGPTTDVLVEGRGP